MWRGKTRPSTSDFQNSGLLFGKNRIFWRWMVAVGKIALSDTQDNAIVTIIVHIEEFDRRSSRQSSSGNP